MPTIGLKLRHAPALIVVAVASLTIWAGSAVVPASSHGESGRATQYAQGELILRFAPDSRQPQRQGALQVVGAASSESVPRLPGTRVVAIDQDVDVERAAARAESRPGVLWAEPNYIFHLTALPNDPRLGMQWGLRNIGQNTQPVEFGEPVFGTPGIDINAAPAWDRSTETGGVVGIVDSGIEPRHPDLAANINTSLSRNFAPEMGTEPGAPVDPEAWQDVHGHGTHVAGIVGALGDNGLGVAGVNWQAELAALRACDASGSCRASDVAAAFAYAGQAGIPVVNASLGFDAGEGTPTEIKVVREAIANNPQTLFVAAAGNGDDFGVGFDVDVTPTYPCSFDLDNLICVAAIDGDGELAYFSNWGERSVDLAAPGQDIWSTFVRRGEPFSDFFDEGIGNWTQSPYPWSEGEVDDEPTLRFDSVDAGVPTPVPSATATLDQPLDLTGMRSCWAEVGITLDLHSNQSFSIEGWSGSAPPQPLPGGEFDAGTLPPGEQTDLAVSMDALDGSADAYIGFRYEANGSATPLPEIDINVVNVTCVNQMVPLGVYRSISGTSMATPFVAGVAGLGLSLAPEADVIELKGALLDTATRTTSLIGKTVSGGRLNAGGLLDQLSPLPPKPSPTPEPEPEPSADKPAQLLMRVAPRLRRVAPHRPTLYRVAVRNVGEQMARRFRVCLVAPRRFIRGGRCTLAHGLAGGQRRLARFRVKPRANARAGRMYRLRMVTGARGAERRSRRAGLRIVQPRRNGAQTRRPAA